MVYVAGGALALGLIGYAGYKIYQYTQAVAQAEASSAGGDM